MSKQTNNNNATVDEIVLKTSNIDLGQGQHVSVKAYKNQDIRRFAFHKDGTFDALVDTLCSVFGLQDASQLVVKYTDDEGDLVLLSSDTELYHAIQLAIMEAQAEQKPTPSMKMHLQDTPVSNETPQDNDDSMSVSSISSANSNSNVNTDVDGIELSDEVKEKLEGLNSEDLVRVFSDLPTRHVPHHVVEKIIKSRLYKLEEGQDDDFTGGWSKGRGRKHGHGHHHGHSHGRGNRWAKNNNNNGGKQWNNHNGDRHCNRSKWNKNHNHTHENGNGNGNGNNGEWKKQNKGGNGGRMRARFVKHVTMDNDAIVAPDLEFTKTWLLRNESDIAWPQECQLLFVSRKNGDLMGAQEQVDVVGGLEPGQEREVSVDMVAPSDEGAYCGFWRLADKETGKKFGQRIQCRITVRKPQETSNSSNTHSDLSDDDSSSSSSSDEDSEDEIDTEDALDALILLGFKHEKQNRKLLAKYNNDVQAVVEHLVRKKEKRENKRKEKTSRK